MDVLVLFVILVFIMCITMKVREMYRYSLNRNDKKYYHSCYKNKLDGFCRDMFKYHTSLFFDGGAVRSTDKDSFKINIMGKNYIPRCVRPNYSGGSDFRTRQQIVDKVRACKPKNNPNINSMEYRSCTKNTLDRFCKNAGLGDYSKLHFDKKIYDTDGWKLIVNIGNDSYVPRCVKADYKGDKDFRTRQHIVDKVKWC